MGLQAVSRKRILEEAPELREVRSSLIRAVASWGSLLFNKIFGVPVVGWLCSCFLIEIWAVKN